MDLLHMSMSDALAFSGSVNQATHLSPEDESQNVASLHTKGATVSEKRAVKRRASRACQYCRVKKIKCSVVKSGSPCNTCQLDKVICVVTKSRRNKSRRDAGVLVDRLSSHHGKDHRQWSLSEDLTTLRQVSVSSESIGPGEVIQIGGQSGP